MMKAIRSLSNDWAKRWLKAASILLVCIALSWGWAEGALAADRKSQLAKGNAITDPNSLLQYALPIDNKPVRVLQASLEEMSDALRNRRWAPISRNAAQASRILSAPDKILASIPSERQARAEELLKQLKEGLERLRAGVEAQDKDAVWNERRTLLSQVGEVEQLMVTKFPFEVPEEYANLPQLKGRATVEMETTKGNLTIVADGYSAPVNAGNFIDLVDRGFYDGLEFLPGQSFVVQVGDPAGDETGFIDPKSGQYRAIPLEVLIKGEEKPIYGSTLEDLGLYLEPLALPFSAYGTVALARPGDDANGGSSQIFFFLFDNELTPPGYNLMDGRYSVIGYLVEGKETLGSLQPGDRVISAKVVSGDENLVRPGA
ncbi:peptidylprolyl isomerase [Oscillatoria sp. FACHB-1406]|uniref:peptidylprolyl isomerase n=1 Tax=Oscillatoria sp. FACHB-1406 TaxID=2692846 RepID=UPI001F54C591|nr:peptidylprolyl isomerase [Oscillatoria sp. FACHB-1406]